MDNLDQKVKLNSKKMVVRIVAVAILAIVVVFGVLFYYQSQGLIKVFPTAKDFEIRKLTSIDENKFRPAEGLDMKIFDDKISQLQNLRSEILKDPENPSNWDDFAQIKEFLNDHQGAIDAWEMAYQLQPYNFRTTYNLANVYQYFIKDYQKAEEYYLETLELQPGLTIAYQGLMDLYRYNLPDSQDKYEPIVLQAIEKNSANSVEYYSQLISFFESKNNQDLDKAKAYYSELKKIDPKKAASVLGNYPNLK
ncbi:MAG: hypothetical protein JW816_01920 [Candidatus Buchananbacteria bacterium]|nr:hypothetical protein [Candidatus Buchananbacteria bacterium]